MSVRIPPQAENTTNNCHIKSNMLSTPQNEALITLSHEDKFSVISQVCHCHPLYFLRRHQPLDIVLHHRGVAGHPLDRRGRHGLAVQFNKSSSYSNENWAQTTKVNISKYCTWSN